MTTALPGGGPAAGLRASVAGSLAGKAAEMLTLLLLATVVPRALGPAEYGRFAVPLTVVTVGSLALTLGGPTVMARFVPAAAPGDRVALARALGARLAQGRAIQLGVIAAVAGLAMAVAPSEVPPLVTSLVLVALTLNVGATLVLQMGLGLGRTGAWSARYPLQNAVLIVAVLVGHEVAGATGAVVALVVAGLAAAALAGAVLAPVLTASAPPVELPTGALRFGALHAAGAALVQVSHRGGVLAVALLAGSSVETGYAALAIGIALGVTYAVLQAFTVSLPHLDAGDGSTPAAGEAVLRRLAWGLLLVLAPAAGLATVLLDRLLPAVFGSGYDGAEAAFGPALALVVLAPVNALAVQAAALRLRPEVALSCGVAAASAFVVVAIAAVPAWGAPGGTTAALAGGAASATVALWMLPGAVGARLALGSAGAAGAILLLSTVT